MAETNSTAELRMPMNGPLIAREGWLFLAIALVCAVAASCLWGWWSWPLWLVALFVLQFFRDPPRQPPAESTEGFTVLSPADGRIVALESVVDPWLQRPTLKISVFMNVFSVHANRSPVSGQVQQTWYHPGKFFNAALDKASLENERAALWLKTPQGHDVLSVQIAGLIARRVLCYARKDDHLSRAQRYGFIRFGSRVDVYMDPRAQPKVALGDKVSAGTTILALLPLSS